MMTHYSKYQKQTVYFNHLRRNITDEINQQEFFHLKIEYRLTLVIENNEYHVEQFL